MTRLIYLPGPECYVNPKHVIQVEAWGDGAKILTTNGWLNVNLTVRELVNRLRD